MSTVVAKKIITLLMAAVFSAVSVFAYTPLWVREFRVRSLKISRLSGGESYKRGQPDLKTLEDTGKGNYVAWSNLMARVALRNKVRFKCYIVAKNVKTATDNFNQRSHVSVARTFGYGLRGHLSSRYGHSDSGRRIQAVYLGGSPRRLSWLAYLRGSTIWPGLGLTLSRVSTSVPERFRPLESSSFSRSRLALPWEVFGRSCRMVAFPHLPLVPIVHHLEPRAIVPCLPLR
ncbi:MAG: hypothetical protein HZA94_01015 [Candidatus Vogelbacteria bacterium]|nr:hypothetical protein [Candidatus Vogelbacteria bacterium]